MDTWNGSRPGFTMLEAVCVLLLLATIAAVALPRAGALLQFLATRDAASVVATELDHARTLAARLRVPVRVTCECNTGTLIFIDRSTGDEVYRRRVAGAEAGMGVQSIAFSVQEVDVYPSGITSGPLMVTVATPDAQRAVVMTSAGLVRVLP